MLAQLTPKAFTSFHPGFCNPGNSSKVVVGTLKALAN